MADAAVLKRAARMGIGTVSPSKGLAVLSQLIMMGGAGGGTAAAAAPVVAVSPFEWRAFLALLPKPLPPFFAAVAASPFTTLPLGTYAGSSYPPTTAVFAHSVEDGRGDGAAGSNSSAAAAAAAAAAAGSTDASRSLAALPIPAERLEVVCEEIQRIIQDVASIEIGLDDPLMESGIDSLAGVTPKP